MRQVINLLIVKILESWKLCAIFLLSTTIFLLLFIWLIGHPTNRSNGDWFHFDSSHWLTITIGVVGSLASTFAFIAASKIFQLSNQSNEEMNKVVKSIETDEKSNKELLAKIDKNEETNQEILNEVRSDSNTMKEILSTINKEEKEINEVVNNLKFVTKSIEDALRTQPYELGNIFNSLHDFIKQIKVVADTNSEFYWIGDTSALGLLHEKFNVELKKTHPLFQSQCSEIRYWLTEEILKGSKIFKVGLLDYCNEEQNISSELRENFNKIKSTRLLKKFVLPVLDSLNIDYNNNDKEIITINEFLNEHRVITNKIKLLAKNEQKKFQAIRHFPYQVFVYINETSMVYKAFLVHIGTYNMSSVKNARALITFDKGLVTTLKNVVEAFLDEQKMKIDRDIELNNKVKKLKTLIKSDETETINLVLEIYNSIEGNK